MEKNNEHNDKQAVSKAVAHEMETADTIFATEYIAPPPLFLASDPKHIKEEVENEEKDQKFSPAEITDQEDQKNSPDPMGANLKSDAPTVKANAPVKEDEKEEEIMDGPAADLIFADDTPEPPNEEGEEENGAAAGGGGNGEDEDSPIQKKEGNAPTPSASPSTDNGVPSEVMSKMESSMKTDFSSVKINANSNKAKDSGALAFAQGNDVHFAPGHFNPATSSGQKLLGHELAHVKQQREGKVKPTTSVNGMSVNDDPKLEKAADIEGDKAANFNAPPVQKKEAFTLPSESSVVQKSETTQLQEGPTTTPSQSDSDIVETMSVIYYITDEMNANVVGPDVARISGYPFWKRAFALYEFADLVKGGSIWDHKPAILNAFGQWSRDDESGYEFFFDIWSNIHYGYIGKAAGFSELELLQAPGLAQVADGTVPDDYDILERGTQGLAGLDDPLDQFAIKIGFLLWNNFGSRLTYDAVIAIIRANKTNLSSRKFSVTSPSSQTTQQKSNEVIKSHSRSDLTTKGDTSPSVSVENSNETAQRSTGQPIKDDQKLESQAEMLGDNIVQNKEKNTSQLKEEAPVQKFDWTFGIGDAIDEYKQDHYNRNQFNQAPQQEPVNDPNWRLLPDSQSIYHQNGANGAGNRKYVSTNGGNFEAVYDANGQLVTDDANMGTYNHSGPDDTAGHLIDDVVPYWLFGNNENDNTPLPNRLAGPRIMERAGNAAENFLGNVWENTGGRLFGGSDDAVQQKPEEELQMKSDPIQRMIGDEQDEEEEIQMKSDVGHLNVENKQVQLKEEAHIDQKPIDAPKQLKENDIIPTGVNVHKESTKATNMGALAFAQGSDIHFAPGQFKPDTRSGQELIGHELGHIVQQKEGRVQPTTQLKGVNVNNDQGLEKEADDFGVKFADSLQNKTQSPIQNKVKSGFSLSSPALQKKENPDVLAPLQLKPDGDGGGGAGGGTSEGTGPISIDGSQTVVKDMMSSQPLPLFEKVKTAPATLNAALSSESTELKGSFPNIEQPTGIENQPLTENGTVQAPHHLGYAGQGGSGDETVRTNAPVINRGPNADLAPNQATAMPPSPIPTATVNPPPSTSLTLGDETVNYSAGPKPKVDTSGDADPGKMTTKETQDTVKVESKKTLADVEIDKDHGEEDIYPHYTELENLTPDVEIPQGQEIPIPLFEELTEKSAEIDAGFNAQAQSKLDQDMAQHVASNEAEVQKMNQGSEEEWTTYETSKTEEEARVKTEQETAQKTAKTEVTTQQENWKKENEDVKKKFVTDAAVAKTDYQGQIDTEIKTADTDVKNTFNQAEIDAAKEAEVAQKDADAKEAESDKGSSNPVGWLIDQASKGLDWLKDQFNAIIDWLKEAVEAIIEAAKTLANTIIEAARRAITGLIKAFGELLKTFVDIAFAAFPEIRDRIKDFIDTAVDTAVEVVNTLADGLKDFVNALLDALGAVLTFLLDAYQKYINLLLSVIEFLVVGLYELYKGLTNLALSAKQSPGLFMGQLQEEFLGMNLNDKLPFERDTHPDPATFRPPVAGETMPSIPGMPPVLEKNPLDASDIEVTSISEPAGPELSEDIMNTIPDGGEKEFGGSGEDELDLLRQAYATTDSEDGEMTEGTEVMPEANSYPYAHLADDPHARADAELDTFLGNQPAPDGASASKDSGGTKADSSAIDESAKIGPFTAGQRFRYLRTQMWNGIKSWFSANKVAIITAIVAAVVIGIALIIASGGAVLSLIPPLMTVLGAFFLGEALIKAGVYLKNFLTKAWGGGAGIADGAKDFARALVIVVVELIFILLFDLNTVIKAAKAGLKSTIRSAAAGAKNTTKALLKAGRETVENTATSLLKVGGRALDIAQGGRKIVSEGLSSGFSRGAKTVNDLMDRVKNLKFKKFKLVRSGKWFKLYGKINPWVLLASGSIEHIEQSNLVKSGDDATARLGDAVSYVDDAGEVIGDGVVVGVVKNQNGTGSKYVNDLAEMSETDRIAEQARLIAMEEADRLKEIRVNSGFDYSVFGGKVEEVAKNRGKLADNMASTKPTGANFEAHHILPVELMQNSDLLRKAVDGGFEFNAAANGRWIKSFTSKTDEGLKGLHAYHPNYTKHILDRLQEIEKALLDTLDAGGEITDDMAKAQVTKLLDEIAATLDDNLANLSPSKVDDLFAPVRGVSEETFMQSVKEFAENPNLGRQIYDLWKKQDWAAIESLFKENNINEWEKIIYPPNDGFVSITVDGLKAGTVIDRFGGKIDDAGEFIDTGKFVAPDNVPFEGRALSDASLALEYKKYRVVKEIDGVKSGPAIPWFDQPGMGMQHQLPLSIDELLKAGIIEEIN